jgi:two-component system, OmpR family, copper resistance phosphate regulon response regulator CusR
MKHLLIVEDELKTAHTLKKGLEEAGYTVDLAHNGRDGLSLALAKPYHLVILDVMLGEMDGWTILENMRAQGQHSPVLFLTARDSLQDRVRGLNSGADDYLPKPFAFVEFMARVEAILRRQSQNHGTVQDTAQFEDLTVHFATQTITRSGKTIDLTQKEFKILCVLLENKERLVTRKTLAVKVWDIHFDSGTNVVDVAIRRLRQKVDDGFTPKLIQTVRGAGYLLGLET